MGVGMFSTVLGLINQAPTCVARTETPRAQKTAGRAAERVFHVLRPRFSAVFVDGAYQYFDG
ncbi:MAG: hypothetical protein IJS87_07510, partial [Rhodocyclaceae bacterium]|nr:hypothetical protein [Rhodocyclaceae bacterium]